MVCCRSRTAWTPRAMSLPFGVTLVSLIERNAVNVGNPVAYRYLDYNRSADGEAAALTWAEFAVHLRAVAAQLQRAQRE
jgi:fatty-acyl-CoA synthase